MSPVRFDSVDPQAQAGRCGGAGRRDEQAREVTRWRRCVMRLRLIRVEPMEPPNPRRDI